MISSSSENDVSNGGRSSSSVQSALFHNDERRQPPEHDASLAAFSSGSNNNNTTIRNNRLHQQHIPTNKTNTILQQQQSKLLSRNPNVILTTSTRGNLGPPTVLNQNPPGSDWIKDRWQAASDMHGTAIKGSHWVHLDFSQLLLLDHENGGEGGHGGVSGRRGIQMTKIVLDWETAFATDYRIEGRMDRPPSPSSIQHESSLRGVDKEDEWCVLYDGGGGHANNNNAKRENELRYGIEFHESEYGQSPGVKQKLPLHIIHTIEWKASSSATILNNNNNNNKKSEQGSESNNCHGMTTFRYLRIFIRKPARGWGVSLWEVDVYGKIVNQ